VQDSTLQPRPRRRSLNELPKIVFSRTLKTVQWKNARLADGDIGEKINRLKRQRGKDIALFGSADLGSTFIQLGLIDEYGIFVTPVVFGGGSPMFKKSSTLCFRQPVKKALALTLLPFSSREENEESGSCEPIRRDR